MAQSHPLHGDHLNIELFRYLCRLNRITDSGTLPFLVPDTVIFNNARATQWFSFDAESGTLGRRPSKQLDRQIIFQEFSQLAKSDKSEICACFTTFHDCKLQSLYFTSKTLHSFLFGPSGGPSEELQLLTTVPSSNGGDASSSAGTHAGSSSSSSTPRIGILQKFIEPNKDNNEVFQVAWSPRMTYILRRYSKQRLIDRLAEPIARAATFDGPSTLSEEVYAGAGTKSVVEPFVKALVDHVRGADSGRYTVGRCLLFFKVDRQGQMWFLYNTSMRIIVDEEDRRGQHAALADVDNNNNLNSENDASTHQLDQQQQLDGQNVTGTTTSSKRAGVDEYGQVKYQLHQPEFNFSPGLPTLKDLEKLQIVPHIDSPVAAMLGLDDEKLQALSDRIQARQAIQQERAQRQQAQLAIAGGSASPVSGGSSNSRGSPLNQRNTSSAYDDTGSSPVDLSLMIKEAGNNTSQSSAYSIKSPASFPRRRNNEDTYPVHYRAKWDRHHLEQLHFNPPPVRPNLEPLILSLQRQENAGGIDLSEAWDRSDEGANADHERLLYLLSLPGPLTKRELVRSRRVGQKGITPIPGWEETKEKLFPTKKKRTMSSISLGSEIANNNNSNQNNNNNSSSVPNSPASVSHNSISSKHYRAKIHNSGTSSPQQQPHSSRYDDFHAGGTHNKKGNSSSSFKRRVIAGEGISPALLSRFLTPSLDQSTEKSNHRIEKMQARQEEIRREKEKVRQELERLSGKKLPKNNRNNNNKNASSDEPAGVPLSAQYRRHTLPKNNNAKDDDDNDESISNSMSSPGVSSRNNNNNIENHDDDHQEHVEENKQDDTHHHQENNTKTTTSPDLIVATLKESFSLCQSVHKVIIIQKKNDEQEETDITDQVSDFYSLIMSNKKQDDDVNNNNDQTKSTTPETTISVDGGILSLLDEKDEKQREIIETTSDSDFQVLIWYKSDADGMTNSAAARQQQQDKQEDEEQQHNSTTTPNKKKADHDHQHNNEDDDDENQYDDDFEDAGSKRESPSSAINNKMPELAEDEENDEVNNETSGADDATSVSSPLVTGSLRGQHPSAVAASNNNTNNENGKLSTAQYGSQRSQMSTVTTASSTSKRRHGSHHHHHHHRTNSQQHQQQQSPAEKLGLQIFVTSGKAAPALPPTTAFSDTFIVGFKLFAQSSLASASRDMKTAEQAVTTVAETLQPLLVANRESVRLESKYDPRRVDREQNILNKNVKVDRETQKETIAMVLSQSSNVLSPSSAIMEQSTTGTTSSSGKNDTTDNNTATETITEQLHINKLDAGWILDSRVCSAAFNSGFAVLKYDELVELERISHDVAQQQVISGLEDEARYEVCRDEDSDFLDLHQEAWREEVRIQQLLENRQKKLKENEDNNSNTIAENKEGSSASLQQDGSAVVPLRTNRTVSIIETTHSEGDDDDDDNNTTTEKQDQDHEANKNNNKDFVAFDKIDQDDNNNQDDATTTKTSDEDDATQTDNNNNTSALSSHYVSPNASRRGSRRVSVVGGGTSGFFQRSFRGISFRDQNMTSGSGDQQNNNNNTQDPFGTVLLGGQSENTATMDKRSNMWKNYDPIRRSSVFAPVDNSPSNISGGRNDDEINSGKMSTNGDYDENNYDKEDGNGGEMQNTSKTKNLGIPGTTSTATARLLRKNGIIGANNSDANGNAAMMKSIHIVIQVIDPLLADRHSSSSEGRMAIRRFTDEALYTFRHGLDEEHKRYNDVTIFFNSIRSDISQAGGIVTPRTRAANEKAQQQVLLQQQISAKEVHLMPAPHGPYHVLVPGVPRSATDLLLNPNKKNSTTSLGANLALAGKSGGVGGGGGGNAASKAAAGAAEAVSRKNAAPPRRGGMTRAELRQYIALCTFRGLFGTLEEYRRRYKTYHLHVNASFSFTFNRDEGVVVQQDDPVRFPSYQQQQLQGRAWSEDKVFSALPAPALAVQLTSLQPNGGKNWWCKRC